MSTCLSAPSRPLREAVAGLFAGTPQDGAPTIGTELELIPYRIAGLRTAICRAADPARTRHGDPPLSIDGYARFAERAEPLDVTFAGDKAIQAHLTTLFPPVRPRGTYLEFRALDALPMHHVRTATSLLACLLAHPETARAAERICGIADPNELWDLAAGAALQNPAVRDLAGRLIELARAAAPALPAGYLPPDTEVRFAALARRVAAGQQLRGA